MCLVLDGSAAGFCIPVHDEVAQFVRDVEALAVVVALDWVEDHHGRSRLVKE